MQREHLIDALRGFALFGILVVNIQSFAWGVGAPTMGILWRDSTWLDEWTIWLTCFIFEFKIYPLFCFCFGYGFAVMAANWRRAGLDATAMKLRFRRRINFMLWMGLLHGFVIWFGDVLARYALAAYLIEKHIGCRPRRLLAALKFWAMWTIILIIANVGISLISSSVDAKESAELTQPMMDNFYLYADGSYIDTIRSRIGDYSLVLFSWLFLFPQLVMLFLVGALVAQLGWLRNTARHRQKWLRILTLSLAVGLPLAILSANYSLAAAQEPHQIPSITETVVISFSFLLTPAYIAAFALLSASRLGEAIVRLIAPMGKIALSNYLFQSIAMFVLLLGVGFGLADVGQFNIAFIALGIFATQLIASHIYLRFYKIGPAEWLWRQYTYKTYGQPSR